MSRWTDFDKLYEDGIRIEKIAKPIIETFFNESLFHINETDRFCYYDLINLKTNTKYEVKSFSCAYEKFKNIILPKEKIDRIPLDDEYMFILVFKNNQDDDVELFSYYYIKYDPELFSTFVIKKTYIAARNHYHFNYLIPKKYITKLELIIS